jgi:hypothetical protein
VHHYLQAIFRDNNRDRYYETPVTAKPKTVRGKEPRKPSLNLSRLEPNRYPVFDAAQLFPNFCHALGMPCPCVRNLPQLF